MFNFDDRGNFVERVDAASAELKDGYWEMRDVKVVTPGFEPVSAGTYMLATTLTRREVVAGLRRAGDGVLLEPPGSC